MEKYNKWGQDDSAQDSKTMMSHNFLRDTHDFRICYNCKEAAMGTAYKKTKFETLTLDGSK